MTTGGVKNIVHTDAVAKDATIAATNAAGFKNAFVLQSLALGTCTSPVKNSISRWNPSFSSVAQGKSECY
jgi:hypothetical protein